MYRSCLFRHRTYKWAESQLGPLNRSEMLSLLPFGDLTAVVRLTSSSTSDGLFSFYYLLDRCRIVVGSLAVG